MQKKNLTPPKEVHFYIGSVWLVKANYERIKDYAIVRLVSPYTLKEFSVSTYNLLVLP